jgi:alkylhydroperoxidase/carboxymuconolactone decarboxylase family protein YurZ
MSTVPKPPETYQAFVKRYPKIGQAWESIAQAGKEGPLDEKTLRLIKLGIALGALREGAVHANVRKALAAGISRDEIEQVIALAAGTLGLPATVAVFSWVQDELDKGRQGPGTRPSTL